LARKLLHNYLMVARQHIKKGMQTTLATAVSCHGIGLHTGYLVNMTLKPAPCDFGVVFLRTDLSGVNSVRACHERLRDTTLATSLGNGKVLVQTVEHLLAALVGMGVDNVLVELDAPEVPVMDGSALPFVHLISRAGLKVQRKRKAYLKITQPVEVQDGDKWAALYPAETTSIGCEIDFIHPSIARQSAEYRHSQANFIREIAPARTFGFKQDIDRLVALGYARGGSLDNAVVLDEAGIVNAGGLRFPDEFVRHKILDAVGDLSLSGYPILGRLVVHKSGHTLNARLVDALLASQDSWELVHEKSVPSLLELPASPVHPFVPQFSPA
jgi:UDP-3-O-[3-hydroxymyristoyl] N-acetylglucosamine deacetylase